MINDRWDTCAPEALLKAFNGSLLGLNGVPYMYDKDTHFGNDQGLIAGINLDLINKIIETEKTL